MSASLLVLYFKLNVLLVVAFASWGVIKRLARLLGFEVDQGRQLRIARLLLLGLVAITALAPLASPWLSGVAPTFTDGITAIAGFDARLPQDFALRAATVTPGTGLLLLLAAGLIWQFNRLALQLRRLRGIVADATEWKRLHGIRLLVSERITAPFSTRALGPRLVVLPMTLLHSPRNLRLAVKHELQHMRNGDLEWIVALELLTVLCFWNPCAWLWRNEFDCLQEFACDEALIGRRRVAPLAYGECLLEVASANTDAPLAAASNMTPRFSLFGNPSSRLKRRILMLMQASRPQHHVFKSVCYSVLALAGMAPAALVVFAAETAGPAVNVVPITRVNPMYPAEALANKQQGWVQLEFGIDEAGNVVDPTVLKSCTWQPPETRETCQPTDTFAGVALAALSEWKYQPAVENGVAVRRDGIQTILRFQLENDE
ncbi:MAG TPA: M56 family metallopeptidase [Hyphomicrobiales bacterium]|nr:M56 family metallopeptidase [Hyphomicrobiales bacterium]